MLVKAVQCGLTIEQFWQMSWRDFSIYVTAHERSELNEWARTRRLSYTIYCSIPDNKPKLSETKFWELPIDEKEPEARPLTKEEISRITKLLQSTQENKA